MTTHRRVSQIISDIRIKHCAGDIYAPIIRWDEFQAITSALEAAEMRWLTAAATDILAERQRQIATEGWTPELDDGHDGGEMIEAAACYAMDSGVWDCAGEPPCDWPWDDERWKPSKNMRRNLVKAGALILAEIERRDRAATSSKGD